MESMVPRRANGLQSATASAADRDHLPQPVLSRLQLRDRAGLRARPPSRCPGAGLGGQRVLPGGVRRAASGRPVVRPIRRAAHRVGGVAARRRGRGVDLPCRQRGRPDRGAHGHGAGLRRLLHVRGVPVRALVRAGQARDGAVLGVRGVQPRHARRRHAARLDRRHRRMAQRLPRPRRGHAGRRRAVLSVRARPAARLPLCRRRTRNRCARSSAACGKCGARAACCRCCRCISSPTPPC